MPPMVKMLMGHVALIYVYFGITALLGSQKTRLVRLNLPLLKKPRAANGAKR